MDRVNKVDFYCGALLSYLISNHVELKLFEGTGDCKQIQFCSDTEEYNFFVKYAGKGAVNKSRGKEVTSWDFRFTDNEKDLLTNRFYDPDRQNYVVLICANPNFQNTLFAMLEFDNARWCLGDDTSNKSCRITVRHTKNSSHLYCSGTAIADKDAIKIKRDINKILHLPSNTGGET